MQPLTYLDLGGGLNLGVNAQNINSNEMIELANWYPEGTKLILRGGSKRLTEISWDEQLCGITAFLKRGATYTFTVAPRGIPGAGPVTTNATAPDEWFLIVGGETKFAKVVGGAFVALTPGPAITPGFDPWVFVQYKNFLYAFRQSNGKMYRIDGDTWAEAGIAAPTATPMLTQGAVGALVAGNYIGVQTFVNSATDYESNPGPASPVLALAAGRQIDYGGLEVSTDPFVDRTRLYRTLENQTGVYFYVTELANGTTSYVGDNLIPALLGRTVSFQNGMPPAGLVAGCVHKERVFATDGRDVFYTGFLLAEGFGSENIIPVAPDDGGKVRALCSSGERLIIGKNTGVHYLTGVDAATFGLFTLTDKYGCDSHQSMKSVEGNLFWYGTGKQVFRSKDGAPPEPISDPRVKAILAEISTAQELYIVGTVFPNLGWYLLSIPQGAPGADVEDYRNAMVLIYNYRSGVWTTFDDASLGPRFIQSLTDADGLLGLYASFYDGRLYSYNDHTVGTAADGGALQAVLTTKPDHLGAPGNRKYYGEIWLNIPQVGSLQIQALTDNNSTPALSRAIDLAALSPDPVDGPAWLSFAFPTSGKPGTTLRSRIVYENGTPGMYSLQGIHWTVGVLGRRPNRLL